MMGGEAFDALATGALVGVSPLDYLRADDMERRVLDRVIESGVRLLSVVQDNQANSVAKAIRRLMG